MYDFRLFKRGQKILLSYEFRLCWPQNYKITRSDASEANIPLIVVKLTDDPDHDYGCFYLLNYPTERTDEEDFEYGIFGRLLSQPDANKERWYRAFAVPLFAIANEADLKRELVDPVCQLVKATWSEDAAELEKRAFANSSALRWKEGDQKQVLRDQG